MAYIFLFFPTCHKCMQMLQERMYKDFKSKMKEVQRKNEEEKQKLQKDLDKERRNLKEQRKGIEKDVSQWNPSNSNYIEQSKM